MDKDNISQEVYNIYNSLLKSTEKFQNSDEIKKKIEDNKDKILNELKNNNDYIMKRKKF